MPWKDVKSLFFASMLRGSLVFPAWLAATFAIGADAPVATRVVIESGWGGLNPDAPFRTRIVIERHGDTYQLSGGHSKNHLGKPQSEQPFRAQGIPVAAIERLVAAMQAQPQSLVDLRILRPAVDGAQKKIDDMFSSIDLPESSPALREKIAKWRETLRNPDVLAKVLTDGFGATHTDDYPYIKIDVTLADGSTLSARSGSQQYLMLPWITGDSRPTYAVELPAAIDALLPADATNKDRLEGAITPDDLEALLEYGLSSAGSRFLVEANGIDGREQ